MGRYTSVQAYADNNANVRSISYDQATGGGGGGASASASASATGGGAAGSDGAAVAAPNKGVATEKVSNPYGSTAGAGSGEFHVYRHARAREQARWDALDAQDQRAQLDRDFKEQVQNELDAVSKKTAKNRSKRQREKEAKQRKKHLQAAGILSNTAEGPEDVLESNLDGDEFTYVPIAQQEQEPINEKGSETKQARENSAKEAPPAPSPKEIPNDGSFLELMKRKLEEQQDENGPMPPPPAKKRILESRIIDEDEDEGPMLPPGFR